MNELELTAAAPDPALAARIQARAHRVLDLPGATPASRAEPWLVAATAVLTLLWGFAAVVTIG